MSENSKNVREELKEEARPTNTANSSACCGPGCCGTAAAIPGDSNASEI